MASKRRTLPSLKPLSKRGRLVLVALLLWTIFIWSRSLYVGPDSQFQSDVIVSHLQQFFAHIGISDTLIMSFLVRKAGHFIEYTVLGVLTANIRDDIELSWQQIAYGILVPAIDETIQLFVPGRSGQLSDVLLDCVGVAFGMLLVILFRRLSMKKAA